MITKFTGLARKLPSSIYKLLAQRWIDYEFPRHIFIETTATCNLACSYCPREKIKADMDYELFKSIIDECSCYGPRSFSLHLFGEPLLCPYIIEAIHYIKAKNKRHTILLTTNGTLLNKFAGRLLESGVDRIIWSWRRLNVPFSSETIKVLKRIGMVRILIEETPKEEFEKWSKFPRVEIKHLHNYGGNIDVRDLGYKVEEPSKRYPCYHLWFAPAIRWNGDITICCADPSGVEVVGNYLRGYNLSTYWRSSHLSRLRESHLTSNYIGLCKGCNVWKTYPDVWFGYQKCLKHSQVLV